MGRGGRTSALVGMELLGVAIVRLPDLDCRRVPVSAPSLRHDRVPANRGTRYRIRVNSALAQRGFFSPASTAMASLFSGGATGHVAKSVNEHGRFDARLKSSVTAPSSPDAATESDLAPG
jgi:hypothetical protein